MDVASDIDRLPDRTAFYFRLQILGNESSSLVSVLFREVFSHPYISLCFLCYSFLFFLGIV